MYILGAPIFFEKEDNNGKNTTIQNEGQRLEKNIKRRYIHGNDSFDGFGKRYKKSN